LQQILQFFDEYIDVLSVSLVYLSDIFTIHIVYLSDIFTIDIVLLSDILYICEKFQP
jgi:hypothetical protein